MEETAESQKTGDDVQMLKNLGKEDLWSHHHVLNIGEIPTCDLLESVVRPGRITMDIISVFHVQDICEVFCIVKTLGEGTYGQVVLAQDYRTGTLLAAKLQRKERTDPNLFLSELSLSVRLSEHPSIIRTHPIFIETPEHYILTQELAPSGTMHELIKDQVGMPEDRLKRCAVQISSALSFMHMRGLVHRDLKPDNVFLMDPECHLIKLGDFGLTRYAGSLVSMMSHIIPFMAPEICNLKSGEYLYLSASVDTWAYGLQVRRL
ncbi:serine/threonine-protein kinase SBK1-like [Leptodactylus fuscus]|uniref:serine/threonine-protein kinase SBK1-like n=1 Tax=Leptodactylus fuscus TaxID=238119 RepID=UPI003F4E937C